MMNPYIVNRCDMRRFGLQNSEDVRTSLATVETARDTFWPAPTVRRAAFLAFWEFSKKYLALFLWIVSTTVPTITARTIATT